MPHFASLARAVCGITFALALASACGGHSASNGADAGDAAGATSHAGRSSAGKSQAGSSSGSSSSSAGSGSAGSGSDDPCSGPSQLGECSAAFQRWTHDNTIGLCVPVGYGGCGATKNNYETLEACQQACPGRGAAFDACKTPTDCVLVSVGCCGVCDGPSISAHDFIAYNKRYEGTIQTCQNGDVACGACPNPEGETTRKYFVPNCVHGECVVEDIRKSAVTACMTSEDCRLRAGTGCCERCDDSGDVVSVRRDASVGELFCPPVALPCSTCQPAIPAGAQAACDAGHCGVVYVLK